MRQQVVARGVELTCA
ncbi:hypothetical protein E2C01_077012 [Portunus trituberculatus]|uniref:Uncharacterized protein n=1 Tax=Portunus trituberculatus TaxID=210409 RepID=A0A5B7IJ94_PORTR|nr:hypothetical protein [Portunus trituberculatus]